MQYVQYIYSRFVKIHVYLDRDQDSLKTAGTGAYIITCMFNLAMEYTAAVIFNKWDTVQPVNKLDITRQVCLTSRDINLKLFFLLNFKIKQGISIDFHI